MLGVLTGLLKNEEEQDEDVDLQSILDSCLAVRIAHSGNDGVEVPEILPDLLNKLQLYISEDVALHQLGYEEEILSNFKSSGITNTSELFQHLEKLANQPFKDQMRFKTSFGNAERQSIETQILGCRIIIESQSEHDQIIAAEMVMALLESFLATWLEGISVTTESILISLVTQNHGPFMTAAKTQNTNGYLVKINFDSDSNKRKDEIWTGFIQLISFLLSQNFLTDDLKTKIEKLFADEEVNERLSFVLEHFTFTKNMLGDDPKLTLKDWITGRTLSIHENKAKGPMRFTIEIEPKEKERNGKGFDENTIPHHKRKVLSIIDVANWDQAHWQGLGFAIYQQLPICIFLAFENKEPAVAIFDGWVKKYGREDKNEEIRVAIIRGIRKSNPHWYRVVISQNFDPSKNDEGKLVSQAAKVHMMTPDTSKNIDELISFYKKYGGYILCPKVSKNPSDQTDPDVRSGIFKRQLIIRNAWEIGLNDPDMMGVLSTDDPVIPDGVTNAPVLEMLAARKKEFND